MPILDVQNLSVAYPRQQGLVETVTGVSFSLSAGETLGIVGESGCGKTTTGLALLRLLPAGAQITRGTVRLAGQDLVALPEHKLRALRGSRISMVFQDPGSTLDPCYPVGDQVADVLRVHRGMDARAARHEAIRLFTEVGIADPADRARRYAHELSGGMKQRVVIAAALACNPLVLVADEPTSSLDVTIQAQILRLFKELQARHGTAIVLITHDFGVVARTCDRVAIMYGGEVVEQGPVSDVMDRPLHPYTRALLSAIPRPDTLPGQLPAIEGAPPDLASPPAGCRFAPRCPLAIAACGQPPPLVTPRPQHSARCVLAGDNHGATA